MATNLQEIIPAIFTGPNGERLTPEQIAQRQQVAQSLLGRATDTRPDAGGWASVLTKGLLGYQSGAGQRAADAAIAQNAEQSQNDIAALLNGGTAFPSAVAAGASPTSAIATGTPVSVPTGDMAGTIRQGLINRGLAPHLADAAILNFQDESGLNPGINEKNPIVAGSRGGYGLYQLTGPRRREYEAFAAQRGVSPADVDAQLDFFMGELAGSEAAAGKKFLSAPDTATAAQVLVNDFLRPAPEHRQARLAKYGHVATTPQEAIAQVTPQGGDIAMAGGTSNLNGRWNAGAVTPEVPAVAPIPTPSPAVASALMPQQQAGPSESLLAQNDMMLGGSLSPSGSSPVSQALSGYFPDAPGSSPQGGNSQMANIARILGSPYASNEAKQVAMGMYQRQIDANDPMRQLQMQKMQEEVNQLQRGLPGANSSFGNLDAQARAAGLQQGTPEYQQFMLNGGGAPAAFRALDMQAQAAGFQPGTQPYNDFMATRGAGLSAGAAQEAKNQADISSGGTAAGAIDLGKATIKAGVDAWSDYGKLQSSIGNIEESIRALDSGAKSGAVYKMLPNVTEASASLQNAMDRMGLDVIGSVTFGALSEGEMNLAMQTAVPRDLAPAELRSWLVRKLEAQKKASAMLASAAQYLTVPGNTINGWIERNIAEKSQRESQQPSQSSGGWSDAGNGVRIRPKGAN